MPVQEWDTAYSLGIKQIDDHHRHLLALLNKTYDTFTANESKVQVDALIEELINYATYHFSAEEHLMAKHGYQGTGEHLKQHEHFITQIKIYQQEFMAGRKTLALELVVFLKDWLLEHIMVSDRAYVDALGPDLGDGPLSGVQIELA
jgi:hemerythrin